MIEHKVEGFKKRDVEKNLKDKSCNAKLVEPYRLSIPFFKGW